MENSKDANRYHIYIHTYYIFYFPRYRKVMLPICYGKADFLIDRKMFEKTVGILFGHNRDPIYLETYTYIHFIYI